MKLEEKINLAIKTKRFDDARRLSLEWGRKSLKECALLSEGYKKKMHGLEKRLREDLAKLKA